jgi:hypothetical protein
VICASSDFEEWKKKITKFILLKEENNILEVESNSNISDVLP